MLRLQIGLERIHIIRRKFRFLDSLHTEQDIQQPALGFDVRGLDELGLAPLLQDLVSAFRNPVLHIEDLPQFRDLTHQDVAANPARPPRQ